MIQRLKSRGLIPATLVTVALAVAIFAPPVGAALKTFLATSYPCTAVSLTATPSGSATEGTTIVVNASSTCPNAGQLYEFWAMWAGTGTWYLQRTYSTSATWSWNSTGAPAGQERFGVWVKDTSSTTTTFDQAASIPYDISNPTCTAVSLTPSVASPQPASTSITVTATSTCPNATGQMYEFWALWAGTGTWYLQRAYSTTATWTWNSTGAPHGTERFGVWVKDAKSLNSVDQVASIPFDITNQPCTALSMTAVPASTAPAGTSIVVTATSTCPNAGQMYEFWAMWATTGTWYLQKAYSTSPTWTWNSTGAPAGTERFGVWVKDVSAAASTPADLYFSIPYVIT